MRVTHQRRPAPTRGRLRMRTCGSQSRRVSARRSMSAEAANESNTAPQLGDRSSNARADRVSQHVIFASLAAIADPVEQLPHGRIVDDGRFARDLYGMVELVCQLRDQGRSRLARRELDHQSFESVPHHVRHERNSGRAPCPLRRRQHDRGNQAWRSGRGTTVIAPSPVGGLPTLARCSTARETRG
jgi:hypothetical protein